MDAEHAADTGEGGAVQVIAREDQAVLGEQIAKGFADGRFQRRVGGPGFWRDGGVGLSRGELLAGLLTRFKTHVAAAGAIAVDVLLREKRAQPAFERAAPGVREELRD